MKLIARVALLPNPDQQRQLVAVLERVNAACDDISRAAWDAQTFDKYRLQTLVYKHTRGTFGLSANLTIRAIAKVTDAYKLDRKRQRFFKPHGAIAYDYQIVSYRLRDSTVSLQVLGGRIRVPFTCGARARDLLATQHGESDLIYRDGTFYLFAPCDVEEPTAADDREFLGIDMGVTNLAVDSDGTIHAANHVKNVRYRHQRLRQRLQKKGAKSAKRLLKKLSGKEERFATNTNHVLSKQIVATAKGTARGIAIEDLTHLRTRITVRHGHQRVLLHSWAFGQLRSFLEYKATLAGVRVVAVDPRNTSRTCPLCGNIDKRNRPNQATFRCTACGHTGHADIVAAGNIARRASLNRPHVEGTYHCAAPLSTSFARKTRGS